MLGEKCSHGVKWGDECRECQLVWDRELVSRWKPEIDAAEKRIAAAEHERGKAMPMLVDKLMADGMDADAAHDHVRHLIDAGVRA